MVALLRPDPERSHGERSESSRPALRLVVDNSGPIEGVGGWRWSAPLVEGGPSPAMVVVVAMAVFGLLGLIRFVQGPGGPEGSDAAVASSVGTPAVVAPGDLVVVAGPGDTLWSIAVDLAPGEDPRPLVSALIEANGGPALEIGQQIVIPQQLLD